MSKREWLVYIMSIEESRAHGGNKPPIYRCFYYPYVASAFTDKYDYTLMMTLRMNGLPENTEGLSQYNQMMLQEHIRYSEEWAVQNQGAYI